ncbi:MAG: NAD synthetase [Myxococcales bacterium]|nr:NAD synthetase [Myxococcales bacterium]
MERVEIIQLAYLGASVLFIMGLKGLTRPKTAVRGNQLGALGMLVAIAATLADQGVLDYKVIAGGIALGTVIGFLLATRVQMTKMPELVAMFNGLGGGASALVAAAEFYRQSGNPELAVEFTTATVASVLIGGVTLTGSLVAFGKLNGSLRDFRLPKHHIYNILVGLVVLGLAIWFCTAPETTWTFWTIAGVSLFFGIMLTVPIGGGDMPVVIALLNSMSGLAAAATGFVVGNTVLIIAGSLVGASGLILTAIMCKAMDRKLFDVLFGEFAPSGGGPDADEIYAGKIKSTSGDELAMVMESCRSVMFIPGYGMAVAQAQHAVRDLSNLLESRGVDVTFGIHPVAGRMPGHMNVLLAEADIDYDKLLDLDQSNAAIQQTDVAIVIGANDVVNPMAREPVGPISGMPIIDVDKATTVVVVKRSLSPGYAKIPNPLFAADNTLMFFGDAKKAMTEVTAAIKDL